MSESYDFPLGVAIAGCGCSMASLAFIPGHASLPDFGRKQKYASAHLPSTGKAGEPASPDQALLWRLSIRRDVALGQLYAGHLLPVPHRDDLASRFIFPSSLAVGFSSAAALCLAMPPSTISVPRPAMLSRSVFTATWRMPNNNLLLAWGGVRRCANTSWQFVDTSSHIFDGMSRHHQRTGGDIFDDRAEFSASIMSRPSQW